ncbi:MAG: Nramp family divalent metal transporter [Armatimonadota bacterium]
MSTSHTSPLQEKPPVDPGCLPAWEMSEFPAPVAFVRKNLLAIIGPGLVLIGSTIGTGEWVVGAGVAALYKGAFLWVAVLAILAQVVLNTEVMRYTLVTGEPMFTGFMRSKPGPRFWLIYYMALDLLGWWPALAGLAAQILIFTVTRDTPGVEAVRWTSCAILLTCGILLCFGRKIYNTLEVVLSGKVIFVLGYLAFCCLWFVPWNIWSEVLTGMVAPFRMPQLPEGETIQWALVGSVAGFAGIGGLGNILASNYVREKGWGMGAKVGAIPAAFGDQHITLSHIGSMARPDAEGVKRFKAWWGFVAKDQFGVWMIGSLIGMLLPCALGATYLERNYFNNRGAEWEAASRLALDFGGKEGEIFTLLTLLCGFIIMFPGQFSSLDGIARRWSDALWSGSRRVRAMDPGKIRYIYYTFVVSYVAAGFVLNGFGISAPKMMVINANLANLAITCTILHTLYVNCRFLPVEFRPSMAKRVALVLAALFYSTIFAIVTNQTIEKAMAGTLFK